MPSRRRSSTSRRVTATAKMEGARAVVEITMRFALSGGRQARLHLDYGPTEADLREIADQLTNLAGSGDALMVFGSVQRIVDVTNEELAASGVSVPEDK